MSSEPEIKVASYADGKSKIVMRPHEYDGIQEYDQTLPNWWLFIFYGAILFFPICWLAYYQFGFLKPDEEIIAEKMAHIESVKAKALNDMLAHLDNSVFNDKWAKDAMVVANGRETFTANCTACHGQNLTAKMDLGNGQSVPLPGISLVDGVWKYGAQPMDLFKLINEGTPPESTGHNGARMAPWGQQISPMKIVELVAYIMSENPKDFPDAHN
jgi:cytochrome c oxidase cbb3-type subunit III